MHWRICEKYGARKQLAIPQMLYGCVLLRTTGAHDENSTSHFVARGLLTQLSSADQGLSLSS